jgi:hypothetical protein
LDLKRQEKRWQKPLAPIKIERAILSEADLPY